MDFFLNLLLTGLGNGAVYASVALALVLIFRTTGLLNLAQGEMALFTTYFAWQLTAWGLAIIPAILLSVLAGMAGGALIERLLIRPVDQPGTGQLNVLIVMIGLFLGLNALAQLIFSGDAEPMPKPWISVASAGNPTGANAIIEAGGLRISWSTVGLGIALVIECLLLYLLFQKTTLGLKLRAVAANPESSRLVGIRASSMLMLGWALSAGLGSVAGIMVAGDTGSVSPGLMQIVLVYAFAAAALGGFDSPVGAVVGGLIVAVAEVLAVGYVDALETIELVVPFVLILAVLVVRPTGLFGRRVVERV